MTTLSQSYLQGLLQGMAQWRFLGFVGVCFFMVDSFELAKSEGVFMKQTLKRGDSVCMGALLTTSEEF